jgi:hypothetical protein
MCEGFRPVRCRQCGKELPLFKKLGDNDFCSAEHRELFLDEQQRAMVARLADSGRRLKRRFAPGRTADPPLVQPIDTNPAPRPPAGFFSQVPPPRGREAFGVELPLDLMAPAPGAFPTYKIAGLQAAGGIGFAASQTLPGLEAPDVRAELRTIPASAAVSIAPVRPSYSCGSVSRSLGTTGRLFRMRPRAGVNRMTPLWLNAEELVAAGVPGSPPLHLRVIGYSIPEPITRPRRISITPHNRATANVVPIPPSAAPFGTVPQARSFPYVPPSLAPALVSRAARWSGPDGVSHQAAPWWIADLGSIPSLPTRATPSFSVGAEALQPRWCERVFRVRPRAGVACELPFSIIPPGVSEQIPHLAVPAAGLGFAAPGPRRTDRLFRMRPRAGVPGETASFTQGALSLTNDGGRVAAMPTPLRSVIGMLREPPRTERVFRMRPRGPVGATELRVTAIESAPKASAIPAALPASRLVFCPVPAMVTREFRLRPRAGVGSQPSAVHIADPVAFGSRTRAAVPQLRIAGSLTPQISDRLYRMRPRTGVGSRNTAIERAPQWLPLEVQRSVPRNSIRNCGPQMATRLFRVRSRNPISCASASLLRLMDMGAAESTEIFVMPPVPKLHVVRTFELSRAERPNRIPPPGPTAATGEHGTASGPEPLDPALVARSATQVRFPTITAVIGVVEPETRWERRARLARSLFASYFNPRYWRPAPALRLSSCGAAVLMVILVYTASNSSASSGNSASGTPMVSEFRRTIAARSAVDLAESFASGLHAWEGGKNWAASWTYDDRGGIKPGALALYKPSVGLTDYTFEFLAQIEQKALAFVTRAADIQNYYAVKLVVTQPGPLPEVSIVRYPVVNGREAKRVEKRLVVTVYNDTIYRVRTTLRGDTWALAVNDQIVDSWTDDRLAMGGVGLFSTKGEKARIYDLRVRHQDDTIGKVLATIADTRPQATRETPAK